MKINKHSLKYKNRNLMIKIQMKPMKIKNIIKIKIKMNLIIRIRNIKTNMKMK